MPISKATVNKRAAVIKALAHPSRLLIAESLMAGELCVCDLKDLVGADMSTVSKHLTLMREAGVLACEKRGLNIYYRLVCDCLGDFLRCVDQLARKTPKTKTKSCC
jgi:DNA-binding transcriptional ArsR family regulator